MVVTMLPRPADDPYFSECPVGELVWAYRASGASDAAPEALGEVWITDGKPKAQGGDRGLLEMFRLRRDEVIEWLTAPCFDCGGPVGSAGPLPATGERVCPTCFAERARVLAPDGLFDQGVVDQQRRTVDGGHVVKVTDFPALVASSGAPLVDQSNVVALDTGSHSKSEHPVSAHG